MEAKFVNGSSVCRLYAGDIVAELMAAFQYEADAEKFAKMKLAEDVERKWFDSKYVVSNTYTGTVKIIQNEPANKVSA